MAGVSREQVEQAKEIDLLSYLQYYEPSAIKKTSNNEYCLREHDSLKISNGKWHWFSRGFGGKDALTFLVKVRGMDFVDAVRTLCDGRTAPPSYSQPIKNPTNKGGQSPFSQNENSEKNQAVRQKSKEGFTLPIPYWDNSRITAYLQNRGIDKDIIDRCINDKILYESKKYHNCVFVGKDKENNPRFACVRSTVNNFRQDVEGSDKRFSFSIPSSDPDTRFVLLAEAPIDVLSLVTMRKMDTSATDKYHYLSLGGTSTLSLVQYLTDHPKIDHVIICLDNDTAGRKCMEKVKETLRTEETFKNRRISVIKEPPPAGKDFNDTLLAIIEKQKEETTINRSKEADFLI